MLVNFYMIPRLCTEIELRIMCHIIPNLCCNPEIGKISIFTASDKFFPFNSIPTFTSIMVICWAISSVLIVCENGWDSASKKVPIPITYRESKQLTPSTTSKWNWDKYKGNMVLWRIGTDKLSWWLSSPWIVVYQHEMQWKYNKSFHQEMLSCIMYFLDTGNTLFTFSLKYIMGHY